MMTTAGTDNEGVLRGARVLVVEDEFFIALDVETALQQAGAEVVGPFADLPAALGAARCEALSLGVLDIRLVNATTERVCDALSERGVPFVFYSGQSLPGTMVTKYGQVPLLDKPATMPEVVEAVELLLRSNRENSGAVGKAD